jgi:hypothetical protein
MYCCQKNVGSLHNKHLCHIVTVDDDDDDDGGDDDDHAQILSLHLRIIVLFRVPRSSVRVCFGN